MGFMGLFTPGNIGVSNVSPVTGCEGILRGRSLIYFYFYKAAFIYLNFSAVLV